jgi:aspartate aminotransferase-like enzyme
MLWIPGPTEVRKEILLECARPLIGHRSSKMTELYERIDPHLRHPFGLAEDSQARVAVHSTSATGLMEAALLGAGKKTLALVNGAFSKRWFQIAQLTGKDAHAIEVPWGEAIQPERLADELARNGPFDAVTLVSNETSTGVLAPIAALAAVLERHPGTMVLVDLVSYLAGAPVDFDGWSFDFAFAGVQKALALPPGISVLCASPRYLESARTRERRGFHLDPVRIVDGHVERKPAATPCIPLHYALARQLEDISAGKMLPAGSNVPAGRAAWTARYEVHSRMRARTLEWAGENGLEPLPQRELCSPTVSCIRAGKLDVARFVAGLKERGHEISNGYGDLKGKTFRIGHMGDHTEEELEALLGASDEVLASLGR